MLYYYSYVTDTEEMPLGVSRTLCPNFQAVTAPPPIPKKKPSR